MQEISCAPRAILVLGKETLDWDIISGFLHSGNYPDAHHGAFGHDEYESRIMETFTGIQVIQHQRGIVRDMKAGYHSKLLGVLARFRFTEATDRRHKIYGLMGLASDILGVCVDYSKAVRDAYIDLFRTYVNTTQDLDLLYQSQWGVSNKSNLQKGLLSWCPDFSCPRDAVLLLAQRSIFWAGNKIVAPHVISLTEVTQSSKVFPWAESRHFQVPLKKFGIRAVS